MMIDMEAGDDRQEPKSPDRPTTDPGETRLRPERGQTAKGSERLSKYAIEPAPASTTDVVELDSDDRKTQKVSAEHFRSMRRAAEVRDAVGTIKKPEPADTVSPPLEHEEPVSSSLFKEALAQLEAGGSLLDGEPAEAPAGEVAIAKIKPVSIPVGVKKVSAKAVANAAIPDDAAKERSAPSTIPMTNQELAEIGAIQQPRHAIKMAPLTKPPDLQRAPIGTPADEKVIELDRRTSAAIDERPRSDVGLLIVTGVLVLGVIAMIVILL